MDLTLRRSNLAGDDMWKMACKQPATLKVKKVKNISVTSMGDKVGRIHVKKQDFASMGGRRVAALRNGGSKKRSRDDEPAIIEEDDRSSKRGRTSSASHKGKRSRSK